MSLSGYIIEKYNNMGDAYTCRRLVCEAETQGIKLEIIGVHDTYVTEEGVFNDRRKLGKRDFLINRYKGGNIKNQINTLVERSYNCEDAFNIYVNKFKQIYNLSSDEYVKPRYVLGTTQIDFKQLSENLGIPFVAKGLESSQGAEVFLVRSSEDYLKLKANYPIGKEWLYEEFIETSMGRDIRFYSIRGSVVACMIRKSRGDFRANVALGAMVEPYEITTQIRKIANDLYEQTKLDFVGVDLLFGKERPYFCEINVMPGIEGIEKASGINVAKKIIEVIRQDFQHE